MKNVLLTTTALVAFAGSAFAAAHETGPAVSFSGSATIGYNDPSAGGGALYTDIDLKLEVSKDFGNGFTGSAFITLLDGVNLTTVSPAFVADLYGVSLENSQFKLTLSNDIDTAAEHFDGDIGAFLYDAEMGGAVGNVARLDANFGMIDASISFDDLYGGPGADGSAAIGISGTAGNFDYSLGYDQNGLADDSFALGVGTSFGSFSVKAFYGNTNVSIDLADLGGVGTFTTGAVDAYGVRADYDISGDISVGAYYQSFDGGGLDGFGVDASATFGAATIGVYYDATQFIITDVSRYGIDVDYSVSPDLTASVGYREFEAFGASEPVLSGFYVGAVYAFNDSASATISYAEFNDAGGPEFKDGTTISFTYDF